ncbi:MAG: hypothetical protein ABUS79_09635 [Pseudomonadota bacterium]
MSAVVLFGVMGCGGGGSSTPTSADFCTQYAKAVCGISSACAITAASCEMYQAAQCNTAAAAAVAGGKRVFAPGNMNNCLNKVKAAYNGSTIITPQKMADIKLACGYVFQGTGKQLSGSCTTQFECAGATDGSVICDPQAKVCASKKNVNGGDPCGVGDVCPQDFSCIPNAAGVSVCTADAKMGESCATTPCDHTTRCVAGACAALAQAGEACGSDGDCGSGAPYCNDYVSPGPKCSAGLQFAAGLASCSCVGQGVGCPTGSTGTGGAGGSATGAAGSAGGAGGAGGHSTGAAGSAGGAAGGSAGAAGGAGGGTAGAAGTPGVGGAGGLVSDSTGVAGM